MPNIFRLAIADLSSERATLAPSESSHPPSLTLACLSHFSLSLHHLAPYHSAFLVTDHRVVHRRVTLLSPSHISRNSVTPLDSASTPNPPNEDYKRSHVDRSTPLWCSSKASYLYLGYPGSIFRPLNLRYYSTRPLLLLAFSILDYPEIPPAVLFLGDRPEKKYSINKYGQI
jgi:hypothetical protein